MTYRQVCLGPMVFNAALFSERSGQILFKDRFREVELSTCFKKVTCHRCDFSTVYKYKVQQIRRNKQILESRNEEIRSDHLAIWQTIPRFVEIPQTLKCKRCKEVLGLDSLFIY